MNTNDHGQPLTEKYRPARLDDVLGQPDVTAALRSFVAAPTSAAFLFYGDSGTGKTSAAHALARELGCAVDDGKLGGLLELPSGGQGVDQVKDVLDSLHYRPLTGSGWRLLLVNECDRMSKPCETVWLDALEHLPAKAVVVFTTNSLDSLSERFRSRCECHRFRAEATALAPLVQALADRVWHAEGLAGAAPATLGVVNGRVNFRMALQQLAPAVRQAKAQQTAAAGATARANAAYLAIRTFIRANQLPLDIGKIARGEVREAVTALRLAKKQQAELLTAALAVLSERFRAADAARRA